MIPNKSGQVVIIGLRTSSCRMKSRKSVDPMNPRSDNFSWQFQVKSIAQALHFHCSKIGKALNVNKINGTWKDLYFFAQAGDKTSNFGGWIDVSCHSNHFPDIRKTIYVLNDCKKT